MEKNINKEGHLSKKRIEKFLIESKGIKKEIDLSTRPQESLIELINWTKDNFGKLLLKNTDNLNTFINNKIVIDGNFIQYCEDKDIKVTCCLNDSIASWKTDDDYEHFLAQGVYIIKYKNLEFIHAALFHKGNQNEDEVSFFVIVSNNDYDKYLKFRNEFEKWQTSRTRCNNEIYVVGGHPITYEHNLTWDDVYLKQELKDEIKFSVEGFLNNKEFYDEHNIPWKRGLIFFGKPGCGKSLTIKTIISQYGFKPVTIQTAGGGKGGLLEEAFSYASTHGPSLLFLEDLPELLKEINVSHFLQLLDGVSTKEGLLVVATANDLNGVDDSITDRPSRFDRKLHFPTPDKELAQKYLKKWFSNSLSTKEIKSLAQDALDKDFSFAYIRELYITSAHFAISKNKKKPVFDDVKKALNILLNEKNYVRTGFGLSSARLDISMEMDEEF